MHVKRIAIDYTNYFIDSLSSVQRRQALRNNVRAEDPPQHVAVGIAAVVVEVGCEQREICREAVLSQNHLELPERYSRRLSSCQSVTRAAGGQTDRRIVTECGREREERKHMVSHLALCLNLDTAAAGGYRQKRAKFDF